MKLVNAKPAHLWFDAAHWMLTLARAAARVMTLIFQDPSNPHGRTADRRTIAVCTFSETTTRRDGKPTFRLLNTLVDDQPAGVNGRVIADRFFGRVIAFDRKLGRPRPQPKPPFGQVIAFDRRCAGRSRSQGS